MMIAERLAVLPVAEVVRLPKFVIRHRKSYDFRYEVENRGYHPRLFQHCIEQLERLLAHLRREVVFAVGVQHAKVIRRAV